MIYSVRGPFIVKSTTQIIVECAGVGYDVQISLNTYADVENLNEGLLYTYHLVREDAQMLFGFSTLREKSLFELLLSVNGVGANTARIILSSLSPSEVEGAIMTDQIATLQSVKGIGAKTAQRIVLDLKDKVTKLVGSEGGGALALGMHGKKEEALAALITLGISAKQAETTLNKLIKQDPNMATEDLIRGALQML